MSRSYAALLTVVLLGLLMALGSHGLRQSAEFSSPAAPESAASTSISSVSPQGRLAKQQSAIKQPAPKQRAVPAPQASSAAPPASIRMAEPPDLAVEYTTRELERGTAHIVVVPTPLSVGVVLTAPLQPVAAIAQQAEAVAALNAGFFDPQNGLTTSYVTTGGEIVADPRQNARLMDNPDLEPYLPLILNRSEFRRYSCRARDGGDAIQYAIAAHDVATPAGCRITDAVGGGPRLLPQMTSVEEGFVAIVDGDRLRDALDETQPNARSAVGVTAAGDILLVMVAQRPDTSPSGVTLAELAALMQDLGATEALNLDGGSSATLYYRGQAHFGRWADGQPVERPVKTALVVPHER